MALVIDLDVLYGLATGHDPFCRRFVGLSPRCHAACHANRMLTPVMSSSVKASDERRRAQKEFDGVVEL